MTARMLLYFPISLTLTRILPARPQLLTPRPPLSLGDAEAAAALPAAEGTFPPPLHIGYAPHPT